MPCHALDATFLVPCHAFDATFLVPCHAFFNPQSVALSAAQSVTVDIIPGCPSAPPPPPIPNIPPSIPNKPPPPKSPDRVFPNPPNNPFCFSSPLAAATTALSADSFSFSPSVPDRLVTIRSLMARTSAAI